ncbi:C2 calcium-dependent membrane targeting [Corchorus olitorius]|uniref:C2 calcium-dependent membrane targeting n=1 Tax=Corchorus olitorius TaxID=93759 RepID=A0A1R3KB68_9ROSI|nr:C2 calcium-dependent membrane targeting [Corchorus olitorius]
MDSPQSVVSPFKNSVAAEPEKMKSDFFTRNSGGLSNGSEVNKAVGSNRENFIGVLEVYVHQARDIHNICIYHKQDVYAKLCLTSDPESTVSTKIINGGGRNPVFNDNVSLNVQTVDCSLKIEIFMMSRVRNYLEDQLLGFALVPLSEVLLKNGKIEKEFSLSSTDLFHSPAGFVQLSLAYSGSSPEVMAIPSMSESLVADETVKCSEGSECELDKIEFPDPKIVNENQMMVSEYFGIPCSNMDSESSESLVTSDAETQVSSEMGVHVVESFSNATVNSIQAPKLDSPPSSVSTNGVSSPSAAASSESSDGPAASKTNTQEHISAPKEKIADVGDGESDSSGAQSDPIVKPIVSVNMEPEQKVVQQDIVDMYMKSMQQFTESLAKMKLPLDIDSGPTKSENSTTTDQKIQSSKNTGSRVFYGSRAFF